MRPPTRELCAADLLAQAEHGPDSRVRCWSPPARAHRGVAELVAGQAKVAVEEVGSLGEALARADEFAPEHVELGSRTPRTRRPAVRNAGSDLPRRDDSAVVGDYAAGAKHVLPTRRAGAGRGRARPRGLSQARADRARDAGRGSRRCGSVAPLARAEGLPLHAAALEAADDRARPLPPTSRLVWSPRRPRSPSGTAAAGQVLRFDQNMPALPGVPRCRSESPSRALNEYPEPTYRELREAAAATRGRSGRS